MVSANTGVVDSFSYVTIVLMILSILGAFFTIVTFTLRPKIRTYPIKLIMYLCVTIIIGFCAFLVAFEPWVYMNRGPCVLIALWVHYFFISNFLWTFCIAFNFYQMIVRRNREADKLEKYYHIASWGIPAILCCVAGNWYGDLGGVCYIKNPLLRFLTFFIPGLIIISANAILFFFIGREIHETLSGAPKSDRRARSKEFRVYLSIFISIGLSWIFGYLMYLLPFPYVTDAFFILFTIFTPMQGIFIFVFYCLNKKVLAQYVGLFGICIPICKQWEERLSSNTTPSGSRSSRSSRSSSSRSMSNSSTL
jgi:hypothetical protein|mmetsp:Transcript_24759/g.41539  ORF Transcript_24759/g.41539 Transcript_24759/m.41539 type:complete len:308 (-) Transcript_24759:196-1119(-)